MTKNLTYKSTHWTYSEPSRKKKKTNKKFAFFISIFTKLVYYSLGFGKKFLPSLTQYAIKTYTLSCDYRLLLLRIYKHIINSAYCLVKVMFAKTDNNIQFT